jgi:hypothetical protein
MLIARHQYTPRWPMAANVAQETGDEARGVAKRHLPGIHIILRADDVENGTDDKRSTWHPGDLLEGYLQISSTVEPMSMAIRVSFEGLF